MEIPFIDLKSQYSQLKEKIDRNIHQVLDHGQYILGPEVAELEAKLAEFVGVKHALSCSNGTDALILALMTQGIGEGDEVIVPGFSFFATAEVVSFLKATPVFVDVELETALIDVKKVEAAITKNTKAIIPVGLYGQLADMDELEKIAQKHGLFLLEDAAQSFGASLGARKSCSFQGVGSTSFFPAKPLGCYGDGGAVFTNDSELYELMRRFRMHGEASRYNHTHIGMNGRMDSIQCAIMLPKLENFPWEIEQRKKIAKNYDQLFTNLSDFVRPTRIKEGRDSVFAQYTLQVKDRENLREHLNQKKVPTAIHYPKTMYRQPVYEEEFASLTLENSEQLAATVISLPMHPYLSEEIQEAVYKEVSTFYKN